MTLIGNFRIVPIPPGGLRHGMPSWSKLLEAQRWQLVAYLRSIQ
jgi:mono/diheme cytochrome c family protein